MIVPCPSRCDAMRDTEPLPPLPSARQLAYQRDGVSGFAHFGINTFTGREWGDGAEDPRLFNPAALDADQWARAFASAGARRLILTCKHHDGFCLWPSRLTRHSVASSPWRGGKGDVVREVSEACRRAGIGFGIYLSPWDRNNPSYGSGQAYNDYYLGQLEELLSGYGKVCEVWFDGAKGPGVDQDYQVERWVALIRRLQPEAVIFSESGPDLRWIGNEEGVAGETNWSKLTPGGSISGGDAKLLGSGSPGGKAWLVGECDVSIRPGWFYHQEEDDKVKGQAELADLYLKSVGRNAALLLNSPPSPSGSLAAPDVLALASLGRFIRRSFSEDLAEGAILRSSAEGEAEPWLELELPRPRRFDAISIEESVELGQRVSSFRVEALGPSSWMTIARGTTIGLRRILKVEAREAEAIRLVIERSLARPHIGALSLHRLAL